MITFRLDWICVKQIACDILFFGELSKMIHLIDDPTTLIDIILNCYPKYLLCISTIQLIVIYIFGENK